MMPPRRSSGCADAHAGENYQFCGRCGSSHSANDFDAEQLAGSDLDWLSPPANFPLDIKKP